MKTNKPRGRRWLWITFGLLAVMLILALSILPKLFDIEQYRGRIEQALRHSTGWDVELGEMDLSLLRGLSLTISPARLGAPRGGSAAAVSSIGIRAEILPLLRGELKVRRIDLIRPDIELVKANAEEGWLLPAPAAPQGGQDTGLSVSIDQVRLKKGRLHLEDRTAEPPMVIEFENLDMILFVAEGRMEGEGELVNGGGAIECRGSLSGSIDLDLPEKIAGRLTGSGITLLAGEKPLDDATLDFTLTERAGSWLIEQMRIEADGAVLEGRGTLSPELSLTLDLPPTPLEVVLGAVDALFPLPLDLTPPGMVSATIQLDQHADDQLIYQAAGELSAARFDPGEPLPAVSNVRAAFNLDRDGRLGIDILQSMVGGGPLAGKAELDQVYPPGTLTLNGNLEKAALGQLLSRFVEKAEERISGTTRLRTELRLDLSGGTIDAGALQGRLEIESRPVSLPGWDLRGAIRRKIAEKRSSLSGLGALLGQQPPEEEVDAVEGALFEHMEALVDFDQLPWRLERFALGSGGLNAFGSGSFDPSNGSVDILFSVMLDPEETAGLVGKSKELRILLDDQGRLALPVKVSGPLLDPSINVDVEQILSRQLGVKKPEEAVKGFLKKLLD